MLDVFCIVGVQCKVVSCYQPCKLLFNRAQTHQNVIPNLNHLNLHLVAAKVAISVVVLPFNASDDENIPVEMG